MPPIDALQVDLIEAARGVVLENAPAGYKIKAALTPQGALSAAQSELYIMQCIYLCC
jgi:hypothetical protein